MNRKEIRWKQRFVNFAKAFNLLARTLMIKSPSEAEKGGIIQFYEVCFELSWKIMKDYLESEGYIVKSPKHAIKLAFQTELISHGELWLEALEDRNLTSHTYDEATTNAVINNIRNKYSGLMKNLYEKLKTVNEQ